MNVDIKYGHTRLRLLLAIACLLFLVNVFYPLFLTSTNISDRSTTFFVIALFAAFASGGNRWARVGVGATLLIITLMNALVFFVALSGGQFAAASTIAVAGAAFASVGWLLLTSESIRAFEVARQSSNG